MYALKLIAYNCGVKDAKHSKKRSPQRNITLYCGNVGSQRTLSNDANAAPQAKSVLVSSMTVVVIWLLCLRPYFLIATQQAYSDAMTRNEPTWRRPPPVSRVSSEARLARARSSDDLQEAQRGKRTQ